jgi:UDP-glucose 4-epimerase
MILVTGGQGFIGSYLMEILPDAKSYDLKDGLDVRDKKTLKKHMKGCDVVIHLAAQTSVANSWDDPADLYSHNIVGTATVIETAIKAGVKKIIYASSASIYNPLDNPYSLSKSVGEDLLTVRKDEISSVSLRFMNVYGLGQNPAYGTVIPEFEKGMKKGRIKIYGNGTQTRDFIHVKDLVLFIAQMVNQKFDHEAMDVGWGVGVSVNQLAEMMAYLCDIDDLKIEYLLGRKETKHSKANVDTAMQYGFDPKITLKEGLKEVLNK